ncbi:MAG: 2Fe-2S iron-sulfur cluster-binding protein [Steroidobacteraceae bacterium]
MLQFHPLVLKNRETIAADAVALTFDVPAELRDEYAFRCGQHFAVRATVSGRELRRTYSAAAEEGDGLRIGVRVQGEMSRFLAEELRIGGTLDVMTPGGRFRPREGAEPGRRYVAFAAGSGITPILSIASTCLARNPDCDFTIFYLNRDSARSMFVNELLSLKNRYLQRFSLHFLMTAEPQDADIFNGRLNSEKIKDLADRVVDFSIVDEFFICGPGGMIDTVKAALKAQGVQGQIHVERFTMANGTTGTGQGVAVSPSAAKAAAGAGAEVIVQQDGRRRTFRMLRQDATLLEAAEQAGLELPFSCRDGICSTCRTRVVEGSVRMERNLALEDWEVEAGFVLCCQARPTSPRVVISYDEK